ncbi:MAG: magnesium transporter CorA family protein [Patescibacteria group bacterium]|nr:magnesium transporter CorA family protein [Patescibacteria group bacterium]
MPQTQIIKTQKFSWLNIINASSKEIGYLKKKFKFSQLDLSDAYAHKHAQRPKLNFQSNYIFLVLLFPVYNKKTREITPAEIDIFITKDHLVTLHYNQLTVLKSLFAICQKDKNERDIYFSENPAMLLYELLERLYISLYPMTDHISIDINNIEKNIFAGHEREMVKEILVVKRNIVYFRKIMQFHRSILHKFIKMQLSMFGKQEEKIDTFYNDLNDHVHSIWDILENYQQTIDALEDTNSALVTFKLNDIMRTLTIFSVIVFPLTLMAGIFSMNAVYMPLVGTSFDFWKIVGIMLAATIVMFFYFKHKKWI